MRAKQFIVCTTKFVPKARLNEIKALITFGTKIVPK